MSPRPAHSGPLAIGIIAGDVATAAAGTSLPEWIKVTPRGPARTRDGRDFIFDPEALAARFASDGTDVAVDLDHALALRAPKGERVDAIGYASAIEARPDGTYARISWLEAASAVLKGRTHRYVSPTFHHDAEGRATWLHSIALVAAPALSMPALAHAGAHTEPHPMKQIAKALGLPETADEAACLAALNGRVEVKPLAMALDLPEHMAAPALLSAVGEVRGGLKSIAQKLGLNEGADAPSCLAAIGTLQAGAGEMVTQLQSNLSATTQRLAAVEKAARDKDVAELLDGGLKDRKIIPAQREHLAALCATDAGLTSVRAMLGATVPGLQASGLDGRHAETGDASQDPVTLAAEANKVMDEHRAIGRPIGIAEAMGIVTSRKSKG